MRTAQPPITSDKELAGYQAGAEQLRRMIERHESDLMAERQKHPADIQLIDRIRYQLHHLYGYYKGIGSVDILQEAKGASARRTR
jgi:hypothetical protein